MIIEEFLKQRIVGFKNKKGVYITPAFPKLLYVLEEDNATEGSPYWYLTELAAKCTAKRLVPDYISEKVMKESKINMFGDGDAYPCMGCLEYNEEIETQEGNIKIGQLMESINLVFDNQDKILDFIDNSDAEEVLINE